MSTSVLSQKFAGIRPPLHCAAHSLLRASPGWPSMATHATHASHPRPRRCSSLKYLRVFAVIAPCDRGASTLSLLSEFL